MRLNEINHSWRPWQPGQDNTEANIDIPLTEGVVTTGANKVIKDVLATKDKDFTPAMSLDEARAWLKRF